MWWVCSGECGDTEREYNSQSLPPLKLIETPSSLKSVSTEWGGGLGVTYPWVSRAWSITCNASFTSGAMG